MENNLFLGTFEDKEYIPAIKHMFNGQTTYVLTEPITLLIQLEMYANKRGITKIISTNTAVLSKLLERQGTFKGHPSLNDYAGSLFEYNGREIVFINPLAQLFSVSYGKFVAARYISKLTARSTWSEASTFKWELLDASNIQKVYAEFLTAFAIAVDIETFKTNLSIRCIGYTTIHISSSGTISTSSYVLPIDSEWAVAWMRKLNAVPAQKIFQNGKYDNAYLLRYNAAPTNWLWDTAHFMHSWYSELPKDLAFLNAFFLRRVVYWKDLAETNDLNEYYRYNAMDTWATANVWIQQMLGAPAWARKNYFLEFPLVYPCLLSECTGIKRDMDRLIEARKSVDSREAAALTNLRNSIGAPGFNPGSPQQVKALLGILGCKDLTSTDEKNLKKAAYRHPLNSLLLEKILDIRGLRKLATTYLRTDEDADKKGEGGGKEYRGRVFYSLNPHGTDTARLASRESAFWCGINIQNIPTVDKAPEPKTTICADNGFYLAEADLEQAESRDTAYISGDRGYIAAVTGPRDFHSVNASAFFGLPYEEIYDDSSKKTKNKKLRDLSKRTNHGANYNMGPGVMVDTMGLEKVWEAKKLLKLSYNDPKEVTGHLLNTFHTTYPGIKRDYYADVITQVRISDRLTSRAYHHTKFNEAHYSTAEYIEAGDWTRYCFGNPDKNKLDLNSYVAHCPQSLNARTLNEAYLDVFYKIALSNPETFRLHAQIHDSILFSYAIGCETLAEQVKDCMEIPITLRNVLGTMSTFTVPASLKLGKKDQDGNLKRAKYWSDTE